MAEYIPQKQTQLPNRGADRIFHLSKSFSNINKDLLDVEINAWFEILRNLPDSFPIIEHFNSTVIANPVIPPPPAPIARLLNVVASSKEPKSGDYLGFGADPINEPVYVAPFDWKLDIATFAHTNLQSGDVFIKVNGATVSTLAYALPTEQYAGLALTGSAGDAIQVEIDVFGGGNPKAEDAVLAMVLEEDIILPPPEPPVDPVLYLTQIHYILVQ